MTQSDSKSSISNLFGLSNGKDSTTAASELLDIVLTADTALETTVIQLIAKSIESPAHIDDFLQIYSNLEGLIDQHAQRDKITCAGFNGQHAARKSLGIELLEDMQTLQPIADPYVSFDDINCSVLSKDPGVAAETLSKGVQKMAANRREFIVLCALKGRSRVFDAHMDDDPEFDSDIARIKHAVGLTPEANAPRPDQVNLIGALTLLLAAGSSLARHWKLEKRTAALEEIHHAIQQALKTENDMKIKVLLANASELLGSRGRGWSSQRVFGPELWVL